MSADSYVRLAAVGLGYMDGLARSLLVLDDMSWTPDGTYLNI